MDIYLRGIYDHSDSLQVPYATDIIENLHLS